MSGRKLGHLWLLCGRPTQFQMQRMRKEFKLSCGRQGGADVKDHIAIQSHQKLEKSLATQPKLSFRSADPLEDKVRLRSIILLDHS